MSDFKLALKWGAAFLLLVFLLSVFGSVLFGWFGGAGVLLQKEFGPQAALTKYEWFIDQNNAIKKADGDVTIYEGRRKDVETFYVNTYGENKAKWAPSVQAQYNQATATAREDLVSIVSNRNGLVKEYNANSQKFNWAPFNSRADLPPQIITEYIVK